MIKPEFYVATYMFIENEKWEYLFMQRVNIGFKYDLIKYQLIIWSKKNQW